MRDDSETDSGQGLADTVDTGDAKAAPPVADPAGALEATREAALDDTVDSAETAEALESGETVASGTSGGGGAAPAPGVSVPVKGDTLGRYVVVGTLGAGGMGVVYEAFDPDLQRPVALKLLRPRAGADSRSGSDGPRARLMREAQAMARLSHPNILTVYDVGIWGEQVYIAMERVDGVSLEAWLREKHRSLPAVLDVFLQAAEGLRAAHQAKLVHRDFKPDNVLVDGQGRVRVMDFGLARHSTEGTEEAQPGVADTEPPADRAAPASPGGAVLDTPLTQAGALLGTPAFMSPEQLNGEPVDAGSDQFSFAVALFEALYAHRPFSGSTLGELRKAVTAGRVEWPKERGAVPAWAERILRRALSVSPAERFASMAELIRALRRGRGRRRRVAIGVGLLVFLAAVVGLVVVLQHRSGQQHRAAQARLSRQQKERQRLKHHLNLLRERRDKLLRRIVGEKDPLRRAYLGCQIAGLEDIVKTPGKRITGRELRRALSHCMPVVRRCYNLALKKHPRVAGTLLVEFRTDRDGKVVSLGIPQDTVGVPSLTACIRGIFAHWQFPTGGGDIEPLHVRYPFHFKPKE